MSFNWTKKHQDTLRRLVSQGKTSEEIAKDFNLTVYQVKKARQRYKIHFTPAKTGSVKQKAGEKVVLTPLQKDAVNYHRKQHQELLREREREDLIAKAIIDASKKPYSPSPANPFKCSSPDSTPISLVAMLSDWHVGSFVNREETMGLGHYNNNVFLDRVWTLLQKTFAIARASSSPVEELVVSLIGDMIDGGLDHGAEVENTMTVVDQTMLCAHAVAQYLRAVCSVFPSVRVNNTVGNHPRLPGQHRVPTKGRYSNFDQIVAHLAYGLTRELPNLHWTLNRQMFQRFKVQGHEVMTLHSDTWRGGDKALGLPAHAIARHISSVSQMACKVRGVTPSLILHGHWHRPWMLPHSNGFVIGNGSTVGADTYAVSSGFSLCEPSQNLLAVHPDLGLISMHPVYLQDAKEGCGKNFGLEAFC